MRGFIYRTGIAIKELGERIQWVWLVRLGYWILGFAAEMIVKKRIRRRNKK
jgi:hypothetical protein